MLVIAAGIVHYASPPRLTRVLITAIANLEKTYLEALETGLLSASDIDTAEMLSTCAPCTFIRIIFNHWTAYNSRSQKYEKPPCATPFLTPEPSANFSGVVHSPSCSASMRCGCSRRTSRYVLPSPLRCTAPLILLSKILKESQLREDNPFANRVCLRCRRHSPDSN
jgi:hypothetical protein